MMINEGCALNAQNTMIGLARASELVRRFRRDHKPAPCDWRLDEQRKVVMEFESSWRNVRLSFLPITGAPDLVFIRAINWRFEDEPHGAYDRTAACALYREALRLGFRRIDTNGAEVCPAT